MNTMRERGSVSLPALERHRRMKNMLRSLQHHGAALAGHVDDTFHPQQIRPAQ